jgi:hypothetical protein
VSTSDRVLLDEIASNRFAALISALLDTGPEARDLWERHEIALPQRQCSTWVRHPSRGLIETRTLMILLSTRTWGIGGPHGQKTRQPCLLSPS